MSQIQDIEAQVEERQVSRLLYFSDAVFAIVLTLLALELKVPEGKTHAELTRGLAAMTWDFVAFAGSFILVAVWWMGHMTTMRRLIKFDWIVASLNLLFLMTVCLMPFSTSLRSHGRDAYLPWEIYSWNLILTSAVMTAMVLAIWRDGGRLVGGMIRGERMYRALTAGAPGLAFIFSLMILKLGHQKVAMVVPLLILVELLILYLFVRPKAVADRP